VRINATYSA